jgi:hypothetical protein
LTASPFEQMLKGFDEESFMLWRVCEPGVTDVDKGASE